MSGRLQGQVILNTRPQHQQAGLSIYFEQLGARVLSFPVIEILPVDAGKAQRQMMANIGQYDFLLFVSRNAVDGAFRLIDRSQLLPDQRFGVIGSATRLALAGKIEDLDNCLVAGVPYNSEAMLATDCLQQISGKRILIFRGQKGRNLLGDELAARGASVDYCEVYRRGLPQQEVEEFNRLVANAFPTLAILTSNMGMHNLIELVDPAAAERLCRIPWLLISERMRESALNLGHNAPIIIAQSASDEGIQQTINRELIGHKHQQ